MLIVFPALFGVFSKVFGVVPIAPTTIGIILMFTFQSLLSSRGQIQVFTHFLLFLLFYCCVSGHCRVYQECRFVVLLYNYNIWSSVFNHVHLDTYTSDRILTFSVSVTMVQTYVGTIVLIERGRPYFSHRLRWTIPATLSCLFL